MQTQTFEFDADYFEPSSEQRVLGIAKIVCVVLAGVSLTFSLLDIVEIRSVAEASAFWSGKLRPALTAAWPGGASALASASDGDDDGVVVSRLPRFDRAVAAAPHVLPESAATDAMASVAPSTASSAGPSVAPSVAAETPSRPTPPSPPRLAKTDTAPPLLITARAPSPAAPVMLASASPADLIVTPPAAPVTPVALAPAIEPEPAPLQVPTASVPAATPVPPPSPAAAPFPSLAAVPLPRPSPAREEGPHQPTPAELLGLDINPKERARAERCLANAVYFEARSEPLRGQIAVAQVVMNRVFSPFYPKDVCSVVYQNANRRLACQFTFACDGKSKAIHDRGSWARANRIAKQTLDGKLWVPEVAKSTHYHAQYVRPNWIREMRKTFKAGLHLFYRPYNWGDGSDEPGWVKPVQTAAKKS